MFGVASKKVFSHNIDYGSEALKEETRLLLTAALVLFFVAQALITAGLDHAVTAFDHTRRIALYIGASAIVVVAGLAMTKASSAAFTAVMTVVAVALVGVSVAEEKRIEARESHP